MKSTNFDAHKKFRREITRTAALFEASIHSFDALLKEGQEKLRKLGPKSGSATLKVGTATAKIPWSRLTYHARDLYPRELRFVLITRLVTIYEVFIVEMVQEMAARDKNWLRDDGRVEMSHAQMLTELWDGSIESNIVEKHLRALTNGSFSDKRRFFTKKFNVDLIPPGYSLADLEKVHDVRNLFVHRGGSPDSIYSRKYGLTKRQARHRISVSNSDIYDATTLFEAAAWHVSSELQKKYSTKIQRKFAFGTVSLAAGHAAHLIEFSCKTANTLKVFQDMSFVVTGTTDWADYVVWQGIELRSVSALVTGALTSLFKALDDLVMTDEIYQLKTTKISRTPKP